jgi:hypothetical protein
MTDEAGDFDLQVEQRLELIKQNPETRDRMLAEIHVFLAEMDRGIRHMIQNGPMAAIMGKMVGKG